MNDMSRNALVQINIPALAMQESELVAVLQSSVYPGAKIESIKLAVGYCRAQNLDPMLKPVHIVPMDVPTGKKDGDGWDIKEKRDVVMPGIGLYRIQASRSGEHAGTSEPEFGPDKTVKLGETEVTFPEWCRVTVKRRPPSGITAEYTSVERWTENYATKARNKKDPNAMWAKRPYAQLAKCAEAQALRKAFPEFGGQPTAEEMEGKQIDDAIDVVVPPKPAERPAYEDAAFQKNLPKWRGLIESGKKTPADIIATIESKHTLSAQQKKGIEALQAQEALATDEDVEALLAAAEESAINTAEIAKHLGIERLEGLTVHQVERGLAFITDPVGSAQ